MPSFPHTSMVHTWRLNMSLSLPASLTQATICGSLQDSLSITSPPCPHLPVRKYTARARKSSQPCSHIRITASMSLLSPQVWRVSACPRIQMIPLPIIMKWQENPFTTTTQTAPCRASLCLSPHHLLWHTSSSHCPPLQARTHSASLSILPH